MTAPDDVPTWLELLVRVVAGEPYESPFVGVLEVLDDDEDWPPTVRVFKDRNRYRVEDLDGTVLTIRGHEHTYVFADGATGPQRYDNGADGEYRPGAHGSVIARREPWDWRGDDFTTPTGPARAVSYLGRAAWEVELAPPERKPSPLVMTIDAENGMTLQERSVQFGLLHRWAELEIVEGHDDALFTWSGGYFGFVTETRDVTEEDEEREEREHVQALSELGVAGITVPVEVTLHPFGSERSGEFRAHFHGSVHGMLQRRRRSVDPWDTDEGLPFSERWTDDVWDWWVGTIEGPKQLAAIRAQLAEPPPKA